MQHFPNKISFLSDDTVVELVDEVIDKKQKERTANYVFTKANTNLGKQLSLQLSQIERLEKEKLITTK